MRILASSDLHGKHDAYSWLVEVAQATNPSVVLLAGDLLGCPGGFETIESAQEADGLQVLGILHRLSPPVLYIMGNDDLVELRGEPPNQRSLHGNRVEVGAFNFVGYQFTLPFMGGINERSEVTIASDLVALESLMDSQTVLVTHGPAYGVLDTGVLDESVGSKSLADLIARHRPKAHVHGHIHSQFGRVGPHFNVASGGEKRAMLIDLDSMKHGVVTEHGLTWP